MGRFMEQLPRLPTFPKKEIKAMEKTQKIKKPKMVTPYNAQHIGNRDEQQDYFAYSDLFNKEEQKKIGMVAVLSDGMGGMSNGRKASHRATDVFLNSYRVSKIQNIRERLVMSAQKANDAVKLLGGAGSTIIVTVIKDWNLYWLSIGDSRIYLYRNGNLLRLNKEHNYESVLSDMVLRGEISVEEAINNPNRQALTSYLGINDLEEIDINAHDVPLCSGDSILLCSDGLYKALSDDEIAEIIGSADDDVCEVMVNSAMSKNIRTQDNITVMLLDID